MAKAVSKIEVDVKTRVVADKTRIWALHAGKRRRYFSIFRDQKVAFLELPGFSASPEVFADQKLLRRHVRMSLAIGEYARSDQSKRDSKNPPSRNPMHYPDKPGDAGFNGFVGKVRSLYEEAEVGDLVLVPGYGGQYSDVMVGEILSPYSNDNLLEIGRYGSELVPFRRVRWLPTSARRRDFSVDLSKRMENSHAIIEVDRLLFGREVFSFAYANYAQTGLSKAEFLGTGYEDPLDLVPTTLLVKYFVAAFVAIEGGHVKELKGRSIIDVIDKFYDKDVVETFALKFSSPGNATLVNRRGALALFVLAGLGVALASVDNSNADADVIIKNSRAPKNDAITKEANDKYQELRNTLGAPELDGLLAKEAQDAKDNLKVKIDVDVKKE